MVQPICGTRPGWLVTVPMPVPPPVTVSVLAGVNFAVTVRSTFIVFWQAPLPVQPPPQLEKLKPFAGVAVRVTTVPEG
jgi:hypothetical protein